MKRNLNKFIKSNIFKYLIFPFLLLMLWLVLTCVYILSYDSSLSVISYNHDRNSFNNLSYKKLLKGNKISGDFKAKENNLGIVSIRFKTFIRPPYKNEDILEFRIKEDGAKDWYSVNKYRIGLIYDLPFFPFGLPIIADSKNKIYHFEIQSLDGNLNNSIALSDKGQILFSKYQISKSQLLNDKKEFGVFIIKKFISAMLTSDVRISSFIYLLPLIFYLFWIMPFRRKTSVGITRSFTKKIEIISANNDAKYIKPVFDFIKLIITYKPQSVLVSIVLIDIFYIQLNNDMVYLVIVGLWMVVLKKYKMNCKTTFALTIGLLFISPIFLLLKDGVTAEKAAAWAYIFLVAGVIQALIEFKLDTSNEKN